MPAIAKRTIAGEVQRKCNSQKSKDLFFVVSLWGRMVQP
jgi:hypothetical protein